MRERKTGKIRGLFKYFMNSKNKMKIIIFVSFLIGVFLILNALSQTDIKTVNHSTEIQKNGDYSENYLKQSDFWPDVSFIHIDGNWTETNSTYDWCSGSGTLKDPYTIKNTIIM